MEAGGRRKPNILVVDDEKENLSGFKYLFDDVYNVHTAISAEEGKKILAQTDIEVVISDQRMPKTTGVEFLQQVCQDFPNTVRMILTGYSDFDAVINAVNKGHIYYYFSKPWNETEMKLIIDNALEAIRLKKDLVQSEECLRQLSENISEILWLISTDWKRLYYISPAYKTIFDFSKESLQEDPLLWLKSVYPEDRELVTSFVRNSQKERYTEQLLREFRLVQNDNSIRWFSFKLFPVKSQSGKTTRFAGMMEDITEKKQVTETLIQSEKLISIGGLAAGIAHELNNPLSVIIQSSQLLEQRLAKNTQGQKPTGEITQDSDAIRNFLEKNSVFKSLSLIKEAGSRSATIISDMITFSRRSDSKKEDLPIQGILDNIINISRADFDLNKETDYKKITIIKEFGENIPAIHCNEVEIGQVFLNLLRNAAQAIATAPKSKPGKIIVRAKVVQDTILIEFEDNGPGMEPSIMNRVFEPFFTTKAKGKGTGLGLSIAYKIITFNHKGAFSVISKPGKGTTFSIRLPI